MTFLGIQADMQAVVFSLLAAVLHVGNIEFAAQGEGSIVKNPEQLKLAADLLGLKVIPSFP
jgi:myosin heavy subunit